MPEDDISALRSKLSGEQQALLKKRLAEIRTGTTQTRGIPRRAGTDAPPLSFSQQRFWFLDQLRPGNPSYNLPANVRLAGRLNVEILERSINEIVRRHEVLRTSFDSSEGEVVQRIAAETIVPLPVIDLCELPPEQREAEALQLAAEHGRRPFDLSRGPLLRAGLLKLGDEEHILLLTIHHIVSDGWSTGVIVRELTTLYKAYLDNRPEHAPAELPIQYADFAAWQRELFESGGLDAQLNYWKQQLGGTLPVLRLPSDRPRPRAQSFRGAKVWLSLPAHLSKTLLELGRPEGVTLFMTLLAIYAVLLRRYTGQEEIVVGTPIANRNRVETTALVGCFVNTLVLRLKLSGDPTLRQLLAHVKQTALEAYAHQDLPFEKLVEELQPGREANRPPLFQVMFGLYNTQIPPLDLPGLKLSLFEVEAETTNFDLSFAAQETREGILCMLTYSTDMFDEATARRMLEHFRVLAGEGAAHPDRRTGSLQMLTEEERRRVLSEWNATAVEYPSHLCLHELFEAQAKRTPEVLAIESAEESLSYAELDARANRLAHYLRSLGVGPEMLVGIYLERSPEMIAGLLGILKAGAAYVALDTSDPLERLAYVVEDSGISVLITKSRLIGGLPEQQACRVVCLDTEAEAVARQSGDAPASGVTPRNSAYVIYTSGSTGRPKGTVVEHRNVVNYLCWINDNLLGEVSLLPFITKPTFDASLKQMFAPLLRGAHVWILAEGIAARPPELLRELAARRGVALNCVPSLWKALLDEMESEQVEIPADSLKWLFVGGEQLGEELMERSFSLLPHLQIFNLYGPTEATANASIGRIERNSAVNIGRALGNYRIYVLDAQRQLLPAGIPGEIHVGGYGPARGYLNRPELTAEKFIPDPFAPNPGERLYRTGDLARQLNDGQLEFLGRLDYQVKIRGFRVELGEIESVLNGHAGVREAVVMKEGEPEAEHLSAYVAVKQDGNVSSQALRDFLRMKLPEYMVPKTFVLLEEMPLTPTGKIDRRALPGLSANSVEETRDFVAPRNPVEAELAALWADVLRVERVGINDNFFDLGGHSLLLTQLASRIRNTFQVELPLRAIFDAPTVTGMTQAIAEAQMAQEDRGEIERMMRELQDLSPDEIKALLEAEAS